MNRIDFSKTGWHQEKDVSTWAEILYSSTPPRLPDTRDLKEAVWHSRTPLSQGLAFGGPGFSSSLICSGHELCERAFPQASGSSL